MSQMQINDTGKTFGEIVFRFLERIKNAVEILVNILLLLNLIVAIMMTYPSIMEEWGALLDKFCVCSILVFVLEIILRILLAWKANGNIFAFFKSKNGWEGWNIFDFTVTLISVISLFSFAIDFIGIRSARILKLANTLKILDKSNKVKDITESMIRSVPLISAIGLYFTILYVVYAIIGITFYRDTNPEYFGDFFSTCYTLFQIMTLDNWSNISRALIVNHPFCWIYFLSFILIASYLFINVVTGIVVDTIRDVKSENSQNKEKSDKSRNLARRISEVKRLRLLFSTATDFDEFLRISTRDKLEHVGVNDINKQEIEYQRLGEFAEKEYEITLDDFLTSYETTLKFYMKHKSQLTAWFANNEENLHQLLTRWFLDEQTEKDEITKIINNADKGVHIIVLIFILSGILPEDEKTDNDKVIENFNSHANKLLKFLEEHTKDNTKYERLNALISFDEELKEGTINKTLLALYKLCYDTIYEYNYIDDLEAKEEESRAIDDMLIFPPIDGYWYNPSQYENDKVYWKIESLNNGFFLYRLENNNLGIFFHKYELYIYVDDESQVLGHVYNPKETIKLVKGDKIDAENFTQRLKIEFDDDENPNTIIITTTSSNKFVEIPSLTRCPEGQTREFEKHEENWINADMDYSMMMTLSAITRDFLYFEIPEKGGYYRFQRKRISTKIRPHRNECGVCEFDDGSVYIRFTAIDKSFDVSNPDNGIEIVDKIEIPSVFDEYEE